MTSDVDACPRKDKWFSGCRFCPRYDDGDEGTPLSPEAIQAVKCITDSMIYGDDKVKALQAARGSGKRSYVGDICTRCGRWIKR